MVVCLLYDYGGLYLVVLRIVGWLLFVGLLATCCWVFCLCVAGFVYLGVLRFIFVCDYNLFVLVDRGGFVVVY